MNTLGWTLLAAPCLALAAFTTAPQSALPQANANPRTASAPEGLGDAQSWRERLQNKDLALRETEFDALLERAGANDGARAQLEQWAADTKHVEFAWTCRLALRELKTRAQSTPMPLGGEDPFEELRQRMFLGGQGRGPLSGFFFVDPTDPFGRSPGGLGGLNDPFQGFSQGSMPQSQSDGFSLEMGPDGVKARVKTRVNGEEHDEEYTAKSLDELLAAHPELSGRIGGGNDGSTGFRFGLKGFDLERARGLRTDVLGVYIAQPDAIENSAVGGLRIERVQPGSLAEKLGLEAGFVLTALNGRSLKSRDDISSVLRERKPDQGLRVEYRDRDGASQTATWEPSKDTRGEARPLQPQGLAETRKI